MLHGSQIVDAVLPAPPRLDMVFPMEKAEAAQSIIRADLESTVRGWIDGCTFPLRSPRFPSLTMHFLSYLA
jgi:hypothetical protein